MSDLTLTSPVSALTKAAPPLLTLTIAWHPDLARVGDQCICADASAVLLISRYAPSFCRPEAEAVPLGDSSVSRSPLRLTRDANGGVVIHPPESRMAVEINGAAVLQPTCLSAQQIESGVILALGRSVFLCLHWMQGLPKLNPVPGLLGVGRAASRLRDLIHQAAAIDDPVLLLGETGTGKEVTACAIHALGRRAKAPLITVNMAALSESLAAADLFGASKGAYTGAQSTRSGFFSEAQDATLFLDEVGNTPASIQPMLLRVLENGEYRPLGGTRVMHSNARLFAATDQDLYAEGFNQALLRRLESFTIHIPPLRARREDIGVLMAHAARAWPLQNLAPREIPSTLVNQLLNYDWPGNVRQLSHVLKRIQLILQFGETPSFETLVGPARPAASQASAALAADASNAKPRSDIPARQRLAEISADDVLNAMEANQWYIQGAAQALGVSRPYMYKLLQEHPRIRKAERIPAEEIRAALAACADDFERCASMLKTPTEALRRAWRTMDATRL